MGFVQYYGMDQKDKSSLGHLRLRTCFLSQKILISCLMDDVLGIGSWGAIKVPHNHDTIPSNPSQEGLSNRINPLAKGVAPAIVLPR